MKVPLTGGSVNLGHTLVPSASLTCAATQLDRDGQQGDGLSMDLLRLNQALRRQLRHRTANASASSGGRSRLSISVRRARLADAVRTSVYALRVKVPGNSHPWYKRRGQ